MATNPALSAIISATPLQLVGTTTEQAPAPAGENPFESIAYILFKTRHALEDREGDKLPRWIRIARAREFQGDGAGNVIGRGVEKIVETFNDGLSHLVELTLDIQEILVQTDAGKATFEVAKEMVSATGNVIVAGQALLAGSNMPNPRNPLAEADAALAQIQRVLDVIPNPEDVLCIGHELYRLLAIVQQPIPRNNEGESKILPSTEDHLDAERCGKARLLQWAFAHKFTTRGLGPIGDPESTDLPWKRFGSRRIWKTGAENLPQRSVLKWKQGDTDVTLVDLPFRSAPEATLDINEAHQLLEALGYTEFPAADKNAFSDALATRLRRFQCINKLPVTGALDNHSINRLLNLDFEGKNIKRAKPFDPAQQFDIVEDSAGPSTDFFRLVNPDADHPPTPIVPSRGKYQYYEAGTTPESVPSGGGWISDAGPGLIPAFVALQSRKLLSIGGQMLYDGDSEPSPRSFALLSEGEAAFGRFFFCARAVEPWIPGRGGKPATDALFGPHAQEPQLGSISRLYQWIPLKTVIDLRGSVFPAKSFDLVLTASVLRRSLYKESGGKSGRADAGRIGIELYDAAGYAKGVNTVRNSEAAKLPTYSDWFPGSEFVQAAVTMAEGLRNRTWILQRAPEIVVPPADKIVAAAVVLEGMHWSGYDTDAYFDDVQVRWEFRKKT